MSAEKPEVKEPKPARWVLKKPGSAGVNIIKAFGQRINVTNEKLKDPQFLELLSKAEVSEGVRLFGTVVVKG